MFISKDAALVDSGEFVSLLSDPVKWPLFLPTQGVTPASAQRLTCQRLSGLFQSHQTQVLGHFFFFCSRDHGGLENVDFQGEAKGGLNVWLWAWH